MDDPRDNELCVGWQSQDMQEALATLDQECRGLETLALY